MPQDGARADAPDDAMGHAPAMLSMQDALAVVTIAAPPVNALGAGLRAALWDVFGRIKGADGVAAVVIRAEGRLFSAGAEMREFGKPPVAPALGDLCDRIEACPVPVVAVLQGLALGDGAALALAAHFRVAAPEAAIGLPERSLGLLPGAGGTQRLPRLVGAALALEMMLGAAPLAARAAEDAGLVDLVTGPDVTGDALAFARALVAEGVGPRPLRAMRERMADGAAYLATVAARRDALRGVPGFGHAAGRIVDCVEAALLLPFDTALAVERAAFEECVAHPESRALRHVFHAESRIDTALLARTGSGRSLTVPAGEAVAGRLLLALERAARWCVEAGLPSDWVDRALVAYGFAVGPFGGRSGAQGDDAESAGLARRCMAALMAEGARLVEEGVVARPSDIDALAIHGLGFPRWRGGPMQAAQLDGLLALRRDMTRWAQDDPVWTPPALLSEAIKTAQGFDGVSDAVVSRPA